MLVCSLGSGTPAEAQEGESGENVAILERGPVQRRGIKVLSPNVIPYFYGEYTYQETRFEVLFTTERIVPATRWQSQTCGEYSLSFYNHPLYPEEADVYFYEQDTRWAVFIVIDKGFDGPCRLIEPFINRLIYFTGITRNEQTAPLPAVIRIPAPRE